MQLGAGTTSYCLSQCAIPFQRLHQLGNCDLLYISILYIVFNSPTALTLDLLIETWEAGCRKGYPSNLSLDQVYRAQFPSYTEIHNA